MHILPRSTHRRLILHEENLILACWEKTDRFPYYIKSKRCHNVWDEWRRDQAWEWVLNRLKELRGPEFMTRLKCLNYTLPKLDIHQVQNYVGALTQAVDQIERTEHYEPNPI